MSGETGPPIWVSVAIMVGAFVLASAVAFVGAHVAYRALARHGEDRVRGAFVGVGAILLGVATFSMTLSQGSAYAEETAFWTAVPGAALLVRGLVRRRRPAPGSPVA